MAEPFFLRGDEEYAKYTRLCVVNKENLPDHRLSNICDWAGFYFLIFC